MKTPKSSAQPINQRSSFQCISWLVAVSIITLTAVFSLNACAIEPVVEKIEPGMHTPAFQLDSIRGSSFSSSGQNGQALLLAFINTQADPTAEQ
jgi:hypothetical protein